MTALVASLGFLSMAINIGAGAEVRVRRALIDLGTRI